MHMDEEKKEIIDKKLSRIEKYWLQRDVSDNEEMQEVIMQITEGRDKMIQKMVDKIPNSEVVRDSILRFRDGDDGIQEDINNIVSEVKQYIELANRHKLMFKTFKRVAGISDLESVIRNNTDPVLILLAIQNKRPELYGVLLEEVGGFEYIKMLTLSIYSELEPDVKELIENV